MLTTSCYITLHLFNWFFLTPTPVTIDATRIKNVRFYEVYGWTGVEVYGARTRYVTETPTEIEAIVQGTCLAIEDEEEINQC